MYKIFEQLLLKNKITAYRIAKDTGIAQSVFSSWKNGVSKPKPDKLKIIAEYFGVTVDYLMGIDSNENTNYYLNNETREIAQEIFESKDMRSLFDMSRKMTPERLKAHLEFMKKLEDSEY